ncbi:MAG: FAD/NAD(P)-binding protein [Ramlibacter sp.]|nr:FAD/NAD(P)-binding protein [Ramlibacter sp.]
MVPPNDPTAFLPNRDGSQGAQKSYVICFVGGGPNTLYCLERIITRIRSGTLPIPPPKLSVMVYDASGSFGPGVHSIDQTPTNHLNRTAEQVSLCADASHRSLDIEVYERNIETLYQWASEKFEATKNPRYHIAPQHWVDRALVGEALSDTFARYVAELRNLGITVTMIPSKVVNLVPTSEGKYRIACAPTTSENEAAADFVFLCTGHTHNTPSSGSLASAMMDLTKASSSSFRYIHSVYPIERITAEMVPPSSRVACLGMGLAAIDCINWLTSGRGGYFVSAGGSSGKLKYLASGLEPLKIYPISESGLFVRARAYNEKENARERRHVGVIFNDQTFDALRNIRGRSAMDRHVIENEVVPLLALEMMMLYYRTLLSPAAVQQFQEDAQSRLKIHVDSCDQGHDKLNIWAVYGESRNVYADYIKHIDALLTAPEEQGLRLSPSDRSAICRFIKVRSGSEVDDRLAALSNVEFLRAARRLNQIESRWGHPESILQHAFVWNEIIDPLEGFGAEAGDLHATAAAWLERDILYASQGNMSNPIKAAVDGAIRDLRPCFRKQVEWGAGGPAGTRELFSKWYRVTNRLAVGTSLELMRKILALNDAGIVDLSFCRNPTKELRSGALHLELGGRSAFANAALNAIVHRFNLSQTDSELYRNLVLQGIVREWKISDGVESYSPGSLDIEGDSRLVVALNGVAHPNMVALGSMVDGPFYYRLALSRPYVADTIIFDADQAVSSVAAHWKSVQADTFVRSGEDCL